MVGKKPNPNPNQLEKPNPNPNQLEKPNPNQLEKPNPKNKCNLINNYCVRIECCETAFYSFTFLLKLFSKKFI